MQPGFSWQWCEPRSNNKGHEMLESLVFGLVLAIAFGPGAQGNDARAGSFAFGSASSSSSANAYAGASASTFGHSSLFDGAGKFPFEPVAGGYDGHKGIRSHDHTGYKQPNGNVGVKGGAQGSRVDGCNKCNNQWENDDYWEKPEEDTEVEEEIEEECDDDDGSYHDHGNGGHAPAGVYKVSPPEGSVLPPFVEEPGSPGPESNAVPFGVKGRPGSSGSWDATSHGSFSTPKPVPSWNGQGSENHGPFGANQGQRGTSRVPAGSWDATTPKPVPSWNGAPGTFGTSHFPTGSTFQATLKPIPSWNGGQDDRTRAPTGSWDATTPKPIPNWNGGQGGATGLFGTSHVPTAGSYQSTQKPIPSWNGVQGAPHGPIGTSRASTGNWDAATHVSSQSTVKPSWDDGQGASHGRIGTSRAPTGSWDAVTHGSSQSTLTPSWNDGQGAPHGSFGTNLKAIPSWNNGQGGTTGAPFGTTLTTQPSWNGGQGASTHEPFGTTKPAPSWNNPHGSTPAHTFGTTLKTQPSWNGGQESSTPAPFGTTKPASSWNNQHGSTTGHTFGTTKPALSWNNQHGSTPAQSFGTTLKPSGWPNGQGATGTNWPSGNTSPATGSGCSGGNRLPGSSCAQGQSGPGSRGPVKFGGASASAAAGSFQNGEGYVTSSLPDDEGHPTSSLPNGAGHPTSSFPNPTTSLHYGGLPIYSPHDYPGSREGHSNSGPVGCSGGSYENCGPRSQSGPTYGGPAGNVNPYGSGPDANALPSTPQNTFGKPFTGAPSGAPFTPSVKPSHESAPSGGWPGTAVGGGKPEAPSGCGSEDGNRNCASGNGSSCKGDARKPCDSRGDVSVGINKTSLPAGGGPLPSGRPENAPGTGNAGCASGNCGAGFPNFNKPDAPIFGGLPSSADKRPTDTSGGTYQWNRANPFLNGMLPASSTGSQPWNAGQPQAMSTGKPIGQGNPFLQGSVPAWKPPAYGVHAIPPSDVNKNAIGGPARPIGEGNPFLGSEEGRSDIGIENEPYPDQKKPGAPEKTHPFFGSTTGKTGSTPSYADKSSGGGNIYPLGGGAVYPNANSYPETIDHGARPGVKGHYPRGQHGGTGSGGGVGKPSGFRNPGDGSYDSALSFGGSQTGAFAGAFASANSGSYAGNAAPGIAFGQANNGSWASRAADSWASSSAHSGASAYASSNAASRAGTGPAAVKG